jgi:hypothetical protein
MAKRWNEMSVSEKCDDLRKSVKTLEGQMTTILNSISVIEGHIKNNDFVLNRAIDDIEIMGKEMKQKAPKKK